MKGYNFILSTPYSYIILKDCSTPNLKACLFRNILKHMDMKYMKLQCHAQGIFLEWDFWLPTKTGILIPFREMLLEFHNNSDKFEFKIRKNVK
jgi:hypothetical protein